MRMEAEGLDSSILDLDMNTIGFKDIPEGETVKYPDGHIEPCVDPSTPAVSAVSALTASTAPSAPANLSSSVAKPVNQPSKPKPKPVDDKMTPRKKFSSQVQLKPLYWDIITSKTVVEKSLWFKLDDRSVRLDTAMLDMTFAKKATAPIVTVESTAIAKKSTVSLLDSKREQAVGLILGRLKSKEVNLTVEDIHHILTFGNFKKLSKEILERLCEGAPTEEEQNACNAYQGSTSNLSKESAFVYALSDIPHVQSRLRCAKTIVCFDSDADRVREVFNAYKAKQDMLMNSDGLKKLMEIILAIGNYLNGESARGGAWGFSVDHLSKLSQTKSSDNSKNLMTYVD